MKIIDPTPEDIQKFLAAHKAREAARPAPLAGSPAARDTQGAAISAGSSASLAPGSQPTHTMRCLQNLTLQVEDRLVPNARELIQTLMARWVAMTAVCSPLADPV